MKNENTEQAQRMGLEYEGFADAVKLAQHLGHGVIGFSTCWSTGADPIKLHASVMGTVHAEIVAFPDGKIGIRGNHKREGLSGIMNKLYLGGHGNSIGSGPFYDRDSLGESSPESIDGRDFLLMYPDVIPVVLAEGKGLRIPSKMLTIGAAN